MFTLEPFSLPAHTLDIVILRSSDSLVKSWSSAGLFIDYFSVLNLLTVP